jgi:hypothetical protein
VDSACEKCTVLNKECSFAVILQSMHHGKNVIESIKNKKPASTVLFKRIHTIAEKF